MADKKTKTIFENVAIVADAEKAAAVKLAEQLSTFLEQEGSIARIGSLRDKAFSDDLLTGNFDLAITLGGDGTVLRAGHLCAPKDTPLLAIHMGRFGFLIEVEPAEWQNLLPRLFTGDYWFEKRMMLTVELRRGDELIHRSDALNEAMIGRGRVVRPVHLRASLDGHLLTTYVADGLIISTATGSTAYALAAGGPILPPELRNILLLPVAPHLSVDRAIVLAEGSNIRIELQQGDEAVLSVDGQGAIPLLNGDMIDLRASEHGIRFLRFQESGYFYRRLLSIMDNNPAAGKSSS
jgi:NAD+ kinase